MGLTKGSEGKALLARTGTGGEKGLEDLRAVYVVGVFIDHTERSHKPRPEFTQH